MTLEEALERNEFLEKALRGAIKLAKIRRTDDDEKKYLGDNWDCWEEIAIISTSVKYESCLCKDEPELAEYLSEMR